MREEMYLVEDKKVMDYLKASATRVPVVGDKFRDKDERRGVRTFTVETIEGPYAFCATKRKGFPGGTRARVKVTRLMDPSRFQAL
jgi:hypothetical protein